jgi:hypothetical protein
MEDMDLYHLQIIRWNHEFGTVPGVANLYLRYGFYSNWLYSIAFFSFPFSHQNFLFLNVTLSFWGFLFLIYKLSYYKFRNDSGKIQNAFGALYFLILSFMLLEWKLLRGNSSSTTYDFVVTFTILVVLTYLLEDIFLNSYSSRYNSRILILLAVSASFYKISGAPIIIILAIYLLLKKTSFKEFFIFGLIILSFLTPFLIKNYIQSGYFFFPYKYFSFLKPDWQVPAAMMEKHYFYISIYNKYLNQQVPWSLWISPPDNKWIPGWLNRQTIFDYWLIILNIISLPLSFIMFRKVLGSNKATNNLIIIYILCLATLAIWFFSSPDPRFAYGFLLITGFLFPSLAIGSYLRSKYIHVCFMAYIIIALIHAYPKINYKYFLTPASIQSPAYESVFINGAEYHIPRKIDDNWNTRCYYTNPPCIYEINPYLEQRGISLKDGFRMRRIKDSSFILNYRY